MGVIAGSDRGSTHNGCAGVYIGDFSWQRVDKAGGARRMRLGGQEFLANHGRTGPVRPTFCLRRAFVNGLPEGGGGIGPVANLRAQNRWPFQAAGWIAASFPNRAGKLFPAHHTSSML